MSPTLPMYVLAGVYDPAASGLHLLGAALALVSGVLLVLRARGNRRSVAAVAIYAVGVSTMFIMSSLYHLAPYGSSTRHLFQRLDHAAIWLAIAGTVTPVHVLAVRARWRTPLLAMAWLLALTGLTLKLVYFEAWPEGPGLACYLAVGGLGACSMVHLWRLHGFRVVQCLAVGGLVYAGGAIVDLVGVPVLLPRVIGPHEIFHVAVLAGAILHWRFIYQWTRPASFSARSMPSSGNNPSAVKKTQVTVKAT